MICLSVHTRYGVVLISGILVFIFFSIGIISFNLELTSKLTKSKNDYKYYEYQYLERNVDEYRSKSGFISLPKFMEENDFVSYSDNQGNSFLISNFGSEEYDCAGSCSCEETERRRNSISQVTRRISYLVVAVSSLVAYEKSKHWYKTICQEALHDICHQSIKSSVESCSRIDRTIDREDSSSTTLEERSHDSNEDMEERRDYFCYGNCVTNSHGKRHTNKKNSGRFYSKEIDCSKLKQEGEVVIYESDLIIKSSIPVSRNFQKTAQKRFQKSHMTEFCKKNSLTEYIYTWYPRKNGKITKKPKQSKRMGHACVGNGYVSQDGVKNQQRNIRCRQIYPEPSGNSAKYHDRVFWERKKEWDEGYAL